jgi:Fe-Mn family superoxide dismutase
MYTLEPLKYGYNALEPDIDARTVDIHYNKHHAGYLNRLNSLLQKNNYDYKYSMIEMLDHIDMFPLEDRDSILFTAGGVLNHDVYWNSVGPNHRVLPVGKLKNAIDQEFGSFDAFKASFIKKANAVTGSGWTFLVVNGEGKLEIINTSNQETPYLYHLTPIMALDLWEHSYYLKYQNLRADYINNFFNIVDFDSINRMYEKAL